ncbi:hypothetical protein D3C75_1373910 [compost metagenome]
MLPFDIRSHAVTDSLETKVDAVLLESQLAHFQAIDANGKMGVSNDHTASCSINGNPQAGVQEHEH